jgi:macrolide-specific efflux system membrane fusion protein
MRKKMLSKKILLLMAVVVVAVAVSIALFYRQSQPQTYATVTPQYQNLKQTLDINGSLKADAAVSLRFPASSRLTWVGVKRGDYVNAWQAIAKVDTRTLEKQLKQDLNTFEKQFRNHDQVLDDYDYYGTPDLNKEVTRILENANFDLQNSVLNVEIRDLSIRLSTLSTPIAGIVTHIDTPIAGVTVSPTDVFQVVDPDSLYFAIVIDEEDIGLVSSGQKVLVTLDAFADTELAGSLGAIDFNPTTSASGTTAYEAKVLLPIDVLADRYRLGLNGVAQVTISEKQNALTIPLDALIEREDASYVRLLENDQPQERQVRVGITTDDWAEIVEGLSETDQVIMPEDE